MCLGNRMATMSEAYKQEEDRYKMKSKRWEGVRSCKHPNNGMGPEFYFKHTDNPVGS